MNPYLMQIDISLAEVGYVYNDQQSALILHISIATNNNVSKKIVREVTSFWMEGTGQPVHRRRKSTGGSTSVWRRKGRLQENRNRNEVSEGWFYQTAY